jgi:hypothetical protein
MPWVSIEIMILDTLMGLYHQQAADSGTNKHIIPSYSTNNSS